MEPATEAGAVTGTGTGAGTGAVPGARIEPETEAGAGTGTGAATGPEEDWFSRGGPPLCSEELMGRGCSIWTLPST